MGLNMVTVLSKSPADVIGQLFMNLGFGTDPDLEEDWPVFVATDSPSTPDNCIAIRDTAGIDAGSDMVTGRLHQFYGFQVRVRADNHRVGWLKADEIRSKMAEEINQNLVVLDGNSYLVHCIGGIGTVLPMGREVGVSKRHLFSVNALATMKQL